MKRTMQFMAIAASAMLASHASAAVVVQYNMATYTSRSATLAPFDWEDHLTPSAMQASGTVAKAPGGNFTFAGYGMSVTPNDYVGFSVRIDTGYQLNLTDLTYTTNSANNSQSSGFYGVNEYRWGYRIDRNSDGVFEQDWVLGPLHVNGSAGFGSGTTKPWDFADFSATGTIVFGLFASSIDGTKPLTALNNGTQFNLNGTVSSIPEPSGMLLGAIGGLALLRRRRQSN